MNCSSSTLNFAIGFFVFSSISFLLSSILFAVNIQKLKKLRKIYKDEIKQWLDSPRDKTNELLKEEVIRLQGIVQKYSKPYQSIVGSNNVQSKGDINAN